MRETESALFNDSDLIEVRADMIEMLKRRARTSPTRRFRLCLHHSPSDPTQEMIIVHCRDTYSRPHRHPGRSMSYHIIEGEMTVYLFDDRGRVTGRIETGPLGSGKTCHFRLSSGGWYMPVTRTETVVFSEVLTGSNVGGEATTYAPWAPEPENADAVAAFLASLE